MKMALLKLFNSNCAGQINFYKIFLTELKLQINLFLMHLL